ncbi:MAG: hypothetical protein LBR20_06935 [Propionibacteriaceae bacterium]|jgi:hypothetical protein|nr:hypothetical protein [Propionibacteriaceae bacterium]
MIKQLGIGAGLLAFAFISAFESTEAAKTAPQHFLQVAWGTDADWQPSASGWVDATSEAWVNLNDGAGLPNRPGDPQRLRIAVRSQADAPVELYVSLVDPDPQPGADAEGYRHDLFEKLQLEVSAAGRVLVDAAAPEVIGKPLGGQLGSQETRVFDVEFSLPDTLDNQWLKAHTGLTMVLQATGKTPKAEPTPAPTRPTPPSRPNPPYSRTGGMLLPTAFGLGLAGLGLGVLAVGATILVTLHRRRREK